MLIDGRLTLGKEVFNPVKLVLGKLTVGKVLFIPDKPTPGKLADGIIPVWVERAGLILAWGKLVLDLKSSMLFPIKEVSKKLVLGGLLGSFS